MKIIDKDGSVQGWFVALMLTINIFIWVDLAFIFSSVKEVWKDLGGTFIGLYLGQFGAWLTYKGAKAIFGKDNGSN